MEHSPPPSPLDFTHPALIRSALTLWLMDVFLSRSGAFKWPMKLKISKLFSIHSARFAG